MFVAVSDKGFPKKYQSAFKKSGFTQIGFTDVYGMPISNSDESFARLRDGLTALRGKVDSYKRTCGILAFTITDKQFGLIGTNKIKMRADVPTKMGNIPVTYDQMYGYGSVVIRGGQMSLEQYIANHRSKTNQFLIS